MKKSPSAQSKRTPSMTLWPLRLDVLQPVIQPRVVGEQDLQVDAETIKVLEPAIDVAGLRLVEGVRDLGVVGAAEQ